MEGVDARRDRAASAASRARKPALAVWVCTTSGRTPPHQRPQLAQRAQVVARSRTATQALHPQRAPGQVGDLSLALLHLTGRQHDLDAVLGQPTSEVEHERRHTADVHPGDDVQDLHGGKARRGGAGRMVA